MPGTSTGGKKIKEALLAKDPNYFVALGKLGGKYTGPKGFSTMDKDKALEASRKGGASSRRGKAKPTS